MFEIGELAQFRLRNGIKIKGSILAIPERTELGINLAAAIHLDLQLAESGPVARIIVRVDIKHPYIGDLRVALTAPSGRSTVIHPRLGGSADDLVTTYDSAVAGVLGDMIGQPFKGNWILNVSDRARRDVGKLRRWSLELRSPGAESVVVAETRATTSRGRDHAA